MSLPLVISPEAEQDLAEAKRWYDRNRTGLGEEFLLCVDETLERIRRLPALGAEVYQGVPRVLIHRFPYGIFYRLEGDHIFVFAVYHTRRDPRGWQDRI